MATFTTARAAFFVVLVLQVAASSSSRPILLPLSLFLETSTEPLVLPRGTANKPEASLSALSTKQGSNAVFAACQQQNPNASGVDAKPTFRPSSRSLLQYSKSGMSKAEGRTPYSSNEHLAKLPGAGVTSLVTKPGHSTVPHTEVPSNGDRELLFATNTTGTNSTMDNSRPTDGTQTSSNDGPSPQDQVTSAALTLHWSVMITTSAASPPSNTNASHLLAPGQIVGIAVGAFCFCVLLVVLAIIVMITLEGRYQQRGSSSASGKLPKGTHNTGRVMGGGSRTETSTGESGQSPSTMVVCSTKGLALDAPGGSSTQTLGTSSSKDTDRVKNTVSIPCSTSRTNSDTHLTGKTSRPSACSTYNWNAVPAYQADSAAVATTVAAMGQDCSAVSTVSYAQAGCCGGYSDGHHNHHHSGHGSSHHNTSNCCSTLTYSSSYDTHAMSGHHHVGSHGGHSHHSFSSYSGGYDFGGFSGGYSSGF